MIRDKALLQRRGDPNSQACRDATLAGRDKMIALHNSIQDCTDEVSVTKVDAFQQAIFAAYFQKNDTSYQKIKETYELATKALENAGEKGKSLRAATDAMMAAVDKAAAECN
ncbi:hypothetical protein EC957_012053 [Mortierella hygrophila]|uniref:Uncharacterized protein n=1 Tax=Mortierella hygrophila TaxID=979708 RepID=A0A9P6F8G9_9FUNG|nr:hypothetical protein EC957_012053 [Mortierella hygrophila]